MRTPKIQRTTLRYPLDVALGSAALVRLIRVVLYDIGGPVSVTDAARMAGLSVTGTRKALETLENAGVVARVGTGRAQKFGPREGNPYSELLGELFRREEQEYEDLIRSLREAVALPEIRDAWIREFPGSPERALELDVIAETKSFAWIAPELRTRLVQTEKRSGLVIEVNVFTRADSPAVPDGAVVLWGAGNIMDADRSPGLKTHAESTERSLRIAQAIAELIRSDPSLLRRALQHTNRLLHEGQGTANSDIGEWRQLLETYSAEQLRSLLVARSSRAERLRRSSPFFAVLTPDERDRVAQEMESKE